MGLSKEELTAKAGDHFKRFECSVMFATSDGCFFEEKNKNFAVSHANSNGHTLHEIKKPTTKEATKETSEVKETSAPIKKANTHKKKRK